MRTRKQIESDRRNDHACIEDLFLEVLLDIRDNQIDIESRLEEIRDSGKRECKVTPADIRLRPDSLPSAVANALSEFDVNAARTKAE